MKYSAINSAINSVARFFSTLKSRRLFSSPGKLITMFGLLLSLAVLTVYIKYPQMLSGQAIEVKRPCGTENGACCGGERPCNLGLECYAQFEGTNPSCQKLETVCDQGVNTPCCADGDCSRGVVECDLSRPEQGKPEYLNPWHSGICDPLGECGGRGQECCGPPGSPDRCDDPIVNHDWCIFEDGQGSREICEPPSLDASPQDDWIVAGTDSHFLLSTNLSALTYQYIVYCGMGLPEYETPVLTTSSAIVICNFPNPEVDHHIDYSVTVTDVVGEEQKTWRSSWGPFDVHAPQCGQLTGCSYSYPGCSYHFYPQYPNCRLGDGGWPIYPQNYICPDFACPQPTPTITPTPPPAYSCNGTCIPTGESCYRTGSGTCQAQKFCCQTINPPNPTSTPAPTAPPPFCSGTCYNTSSCAAIGRYGANGGCAEAYQKCCNGLIPPTATPTPFPNGYACANSNQCQSRNCQYCSGFGYRCRPPGYVCPN